MLISRNPANGDILAELNCTAAEELTKIFEQARNAQLNWQQTPLKARAKNLLILRETLLNHLDDLVALISLENGKPKTEALVNELIPSLDLLTYMAKVAPNVLADHPIKLTLMKHRASYLNYWPVGVVAIISPWNYPFLLPFGNIIMSLVAGNAVVFKPSEITPLVGLKIQEIIQESGFPPGIIQTVIGDGSLGAALIKQRPDKIFFTGSVSTGKRVMAAAAENLVPVNLELGGKDAMIVLPDADLDYASSAALWGSFSNAGQVCASTERILVHERIAEEFLEKFKLKAQSLRQGPSIGFEHDLGPITLEKQKDIYAKQLDEAKAKNLRFVTGGQFSEDQRYLEPTIVVGPEVEKLQVYQDETFGPVVAVATFKTIAEAIQKANDSKYGLLASIITKNIALGEEIAKKLHVGTVTINEVTYTAGLGETPWGGVKESGFGRTHAKMGLYEYVNVRHVHKPRSSIFTFKSLWWFPYTPFQYETFRQFAELYRGSFFGRLKAFPHLLSNLVQFLKNERRL